MADADGSEASWSSISEFDEDDMPLQTLFPKRRRERSRSVSREGHGRPVCVSVLCMQVCMCMLYECGNSLSNEHSKTVAYSQKTASTHTCACKYAAHWVPQVGYIHVHLGVPVMWALHEHAPQCIPAGWIAMP